MNEAFAATLTPDERHLARRLESFGDVVFGFTIAQLALQFPLPVHPNELLEHGQNYLVYFVTFAIVAWLWLSYHRMLSGAYAPTPIDIALTFAYLAWTGLTPYAMYAYLHFSGSLDTTRFGLGAYVVLWLGTLSFSALVNARNYLRGAAYLDPRARLRGFRQLIIRASIIPAFALVLVVDIRVGAPEASIWFGLIPLATILVRRFVKAAPVSGAGVVTEPTA